MSLIKENGFIKCPVCGSTAQIEMVWGSCSDGRYSTIERDYVCGCGCEFTIKFEAQDFILRENL